MPSTHLTRLIALARLWAAVRYQHPWLLSRDLDWDAPLIAALPKIYATRDDGAYLAAVSEMLGALGDPATRLVTSPPLSEPKPAPCDLLVWHDDIALLNIGPYAAAKGGSTLYFECLRLSGLELAKSVVVDVRAPHASADDQDAIRGAIAEAIRLPLPKHIVPGQRYTFHSGYRPQTRYSSGGYHSGLVSLPATEQAASPTPLAGLVVFITGHAPRLPLFVFAMRAAGIATVIAEEPFGDEAAIDVQRVELIQGHAALVRLSDIVASPDWQGIAPDLVVAPVAGRDAALDLAFEWAHLGRAAVPAKPSLVATPLPDPVWRPDNPYSDLHAPDLPHRQLAAFRIWSIIDRFYPYKHLIGDWAAVLPEFIPRFEAAETEDDYARAVLEMTARIADTHTITYGHPALSRIFNVASPPIEVRWIEQQFVVTQFYLAEAAQSGLSLGDVILSVDDQPLTERVAVLQKYIAASTETARNVRAALLALRGPDQSIARLGVRSADSSHRILAVLRRIPTRPAPQSGEPFRLLDDAIGYADLTRLTSADVDRMFDALAHTRALIFDMRGYPNGTAWQIAPRINVNHASIVANFRRPQWMGDSGGEAATANFVFDQKMPVAPRDLYRGKTCMLIDDRTISQAEHSGLMFEAANGTEFIGTPSAGANGDVTNFTVPGGFTILFTGHDVRHADGRQLQRIGLTPHLRVEPTIQGIAAGRDEVLEAALQYVRSSIPVDSRDGEQKPSAD